jgi:hypothetical protein
LKLKTQILLFIGIILEKGSRELLQNGKQTLAVIDLFKDYPPVSDVIPRQTKLTLEEEKKVPPDELKFSLPSLISQNIQHFMNHRKYAKPLFDAIVPMCGVKVDRRLHVVWDITTSVHNIPSEELYLFYKRILAFATPQSLRRDSSWDVEFLNARSWEHSLLCHLAYPQLSIVFSLSHRLQPSKRVSLIFLFFCLLLKFSSIK